MSSCSNKIILIKLMKKSEKKVVFFDQDDNNDDCPGDLIWEHFLALRETTPDKNIPLHIEFAKKRTN